MFNLIQEVLYICPEFRTILLWGGSTMRFCILCRHDIVKAVIPTAAPFLKQFILIIQGIFCAAAAFIN